MEFWEKFSVAITAPCNDAACCRDEKLNIPDGVWFGDRSGRDQRFLIAGLVGRRLVVLKKRWM